MPSAQARLTWGPCRPRGQAVCTPTCTGAQRPRAEHIAPRFYFSFPLRSLQRMSSYKRSAEEKTWTPLKSYSGR